MEALPASWVAWLSGRRSMCSWTSPRPMRFPPPSFVAVPVMLQVQSDGEELQTEGFRMGDTFAVPLKADPAPENNLAILRTGVRFRDTVTGNPNCFLHLYCLTSQEVDLAQADKAVLEEFGDEWRVGRWSDEDRGPRRASYDWQGKSATVESLLNTGDAVHLRWNGNAHDATGPLVLYAQRGTARWYRGT